MPVPRIIFDTDPGADDAIALLWLLALHQAGAVELLAITTTGGNVDRRRVFDNAARISALAGLADVPIARGIAHTGPDAAHVHGDDGLAGQSPLLPATTHNFDAAADASCLLADALISRGPDITLIAVGPLTNLAAAEDRSPGCLARAGRIVLMGGALDSGNITPRAEFNVFHNPAAWRRVLRVAHPDVVTLNVTREVALAAEDLPRIPAPPATQRFFLAVAHAMVASSAARGQKPGFLLHDAVAVAAACYPPLLRFRSAALEVCLNDGERQGETVERPGERANCRLAVAADRDRLVAALLSDTLGVTR